ncbi:MAG: hypothetical protein R3B53_00070 [Candidatus Paceibacterota bacterium]
MKKLFWTYLGWMTFPGFMYFMRNQALDKPIKPAQNRQEVWIGLTITIIALIVYGTVAIYFDNPVFRRTTQGIFSPASMIIWVLNFFFAILSVIGLIVGKWPTPNKQP